MALVVEFAGAEAAPAPGGTFVIGREGDLAVDDNHFLHRQFLTLTDPGGVWLLTNVGDQLAALTQFNRKLDNVCDKLTKLGVRGLQGDAGRLASNRRARLVEYALAVRLVTRDDLDALDAASAASDP